MHESSRIKTALSDIVRSKMQNVELGRDHRVLSVVGRIGVSLVRYLELIVALVDRYAHLEGIRFTITILRTFFGRF